jgi:nitrate/TMAO reductase-like tetraheme cytochrome c subunit
MHAYASEDPLFLAMNERGQREANIQNFCMNCHAPMAVAAAPPGTVITAAMLKTLPASQRGITCYFCHTIDGVADTHNNPLHLAGDNVMRGRFTDAVPNEAHASAYSEFLDGTQLGSAHACGSCHDIVNDHGAHIERTFEEWQGSVFSAATGQTCAQCHLSQSGPELIADGPKAPGVFARVAHDHKMAAVDRALTDFPEIDAQNAAVAYQLDRELQTAICVASFGPGDAKIAVLTDNYASGHKWLSGAAQDRQLWFEVTAYAGDTVIYQSGIVTPGVDPKDIADDDLWLIRDCMFDEQGKETHNFWDAKTYDFNSLPAQITLNQGSPDFYKSHVSRVFPKPSAMTTIKPFPDRATLRVWIQPFPYSVFDDHEKELLSLGYDSNQIKAFRAKLAPMQVSATGTEPMMPRNPLWTRDLVWTSEIANDPKQGGTTFLNNLIPGIPLKVQMQCVSLTSLNTKAEVVGAPVHTTCQP